MKYACQCLILAVVAIRMVIVLVQDGMRAAKETDRKSMILIAIVWPAITLAYYTASIDVLKIAGAFSEVWP